MNKKLKIGDPVVAHKFASTPECPWQDFMEVYDGMRGLVVEVEEHCVGVEFSDSDMYFFPHNAVDPVIEKRRPFKLGEMVIAQKFESTRSIVWGDSLEQFVGKPATIGREMDNDGDYKLIFAGGLYRYFPASAVFPFEEAPAVVEIDVGATVEVQKYDECLWMDHSLVGATGVVLSWRESDIAPHYKVKIANTMKAFPREALKLVEPLKDDQGNAGEIEDLTREAVVTRRGFPLGGVPAPFVSPTRAERIIDPADAITQGDRVGMNNHACVYSSPEPPYENPHALAEWLRRPLTHGKGNRS